MSFRLPVKPRRLSRLPENARPAGVLLWLACLVILLGGCAGSPALQQATYRLPQHVELENVPFYPQEKYQCGPAALATALNYSPADLPADIHRPGSSAAGVLEADTVKAGAFKADNLKTGNLEADRPSADSSRADSPGADSPRADTATPAGSVRDTDITAQSLVSEVFLPGREGSVQPEMLATARRHQRIAYPIRPTFDALLGHVAAGDPVIVMQNLSLPAWPMWHYAVVIGYDLPDETLIMRSGEIRRHTLSFGRFDATWQRSQRWGLVLAEPGRIPDGVTARRAVDAISSYESLHGSGAALSSWRALTRAQPRNAMAYFGLGNASYRQERPQDAIQAFRRAVGIDEELGVAWLNLGLVYRQQDKTARARRALEKAAALPGDWQAKARSALDSL